MRQCPGPHRPSWETHPQTGSAGLAGRSTHPVLAEATSLFHYVPGAPLALTTDASDFVVGGVVEQLVGGPVEASRVLYL